MWLAHAAFHRTRSKVVTHILIFLRRGDVASTQPVHEIDFAHHVAHVPGDLEGE